MTARRQKEVLMDILLEFWENLKIAHWDFGAIWESIVGTYYAMIETPTHVAQMEVVNGFLANLPAFTLPLVILLLSLVETFAGKRLLGFQKFALCFVLGFEYGVLYVSTLLDSVVVIDHWIAGLVVGILAALLSKLVYFLAYVGVIGYSVYFIAYTGTFLPPEVSGFTVGNMVNSLVAAAVVVVLALLLRKWIEMIGTSALGAWGVFKCVEWLVDFNTIEAIAQNYDMIMYITMGVLGLIGLIVQIKTRKRRYSF